MKKLSFLALAIAGMLFAACSSEKEAAEDPNPLTIGDKGYFKVNLNLPTTVVSSMRAGWNDEGTNVDDGFNFVSCCDVCFFYLHVLSFQYRIYDLFCTL